MILREPERLAIAQLWKRKLEQDRRQLPRSERHRNLEPASAEFVAALASGIGAKSLLEITRITWPVRGTRPRPAVVTSRLSSGAMTRLETLIPAISVLLGALLCLGCPWL